ncbi:MAG: hypothetical protein SGJ09_14275 [Phycisphaerae bacterium]|nr:hypothetical protein [Phycisphaerae bacterium]
MAARRKKNKTTSRPASGLVSGFATTIGSVVSGVGSGLASSVRTLFPSRGAWRYWIAGLGWASAIGGIGYSAYVGVPKLESWAESRSLVAAESVRVRFEPVPSWIPPTSLETIAVTARTALGGASALDPTSLDGVHRRLLASGWFERIEQVRRSANDELVVVGEFLVPFALIRAGDEDHVVDARGRRLPLSYRVTDGVASGERPRLPLIAGPAMPKPAEPGAAWIGQDIRAGLRLAALVHDRPWFACGATASATDTADTGRVVAIDASRFNRESVLELVTVGGMRILWGSDPDARTLGEMPPERKLACLDALWASAKRIDDGSGRGIDLRFDVVTLAPKESASTFADAPVADARR